MNCLPRVCCLTLFSLVLYASATTVEAGSPLPAEYKPHAELLAELESLADSEWVTLRSLGKTSEGRDMPLLVLGGEKPDQRPALLVLGSVQANTLVGCRMTVMMVRQLVDQADQPGEQGDAARKLLADTTFYVVPRPSPDASERLFAKPYQSTSQNVRPQDDDNDGRVDEDGPDDLDGDGWITQMRIADSTGDYLPHPDDARLLVKADPTKGERGAYRLLSEGFDNDGDEAVNEDALGGVDLNRNFTFQYPYFKSGAGPHQVSEPESRALANFAYDRLNIFAVFAFAPQQNLGKPWASGSSGRIRTKVLSDDKDNYQQLAELYKEHVGNKKMPAASDRNGAVAPWAYFHLGRWSLATPGWWVGQTAEEEPEAKAEGGKGKGEENNEAEEKSESDTESATESDKVSDETEAKEVDAEKDGDKPAEEKKADDKRGKDQRELLAWFEEQGIDGFSPWVEVKHPDFPDEKVEVGGVRQVLAHHPPVDALKIDQHVAFLQAVAGRQPMLEIVKSKINPRGGDVYAVEVEVLNTGRLPTMSAMGEKSGQLQRLIVELIPPSDSKSKVTWLSGAPRQDLGSIQPGESKKRSWLLRGLPEKGAFMCRVSSPGVKACEVELTMTAEDASQENASQKNESQENESQENGGQL